jgi:hypothetical protein
VCSIKNIKLKDKSAIIDKFRGVFDRVDAKTLQVINIQEENRKDKDIIQSLNSFVGFYSFDYAQTIIYVDITFRMYLFKHQS